jgi:hypothetical protein
LELSGLAHREFLINLKDSFMHGECQLFSPTLLVEIERSVLIRWVAFYALVSVQRRGERGKHARSPHLAGRGDGRGRTMCA